MKGKMLLLTLVLLLPLAGVMPGRVQGTGPSQAGYDLSRHVVAGGGAQVRAGDYDLGSTAGQPAAGLAQNAPYNLCAGFWCGVEVIGYRIYLPLVFRQAGG